MVRFRQGMTLASLEADKNIYIPLWLDFGPAGAIFNLKNNYIYIPLWLDFGLGVMNARVVLKDLHSTMVRFRRLSAI